MISNSSQIHKWAEHANINKIPSVWNAIFANNKSQYMTYRSKYIILNTLLIAGFCFVEALFFRKYSFLNLVPRLFLIKIFISSLEAYWWGYTEVLRDRVRKLIKFNKTEEIIWQRKLWSFWSTTFGILLGLLIIIIGAFFSTQIVFTGYQKLFYFSYLISITLEFAAILHLRTINSSILGMQRVYKPVWAIFLPNLIKITFIISLYYVFGIASIIIAQLVASAIYITISYKFMHRALLKLNQASYSWQISKCIKHFHQVFSSEGFISGFGFFLAQIGNLFLTTLLYWSFGAQIFSLYVIIVFLNACYNWPRLLYFDLKKFENNWEYQLFLPILRFSFIFSCILSVILYALSFLVIIYFNFNINFATYLFLIFILQGMLSFVQMVAFVQHKYIQLCIQGILFSFILLLMMASTDSPIALQLSVVIAGFLLSILLLKVKINLPVIRDYMVSENIFTDWITSYKYLNKNKHCSLFRIRFDQRTKFFYLQDIAIKIKDYYPNSLILRFNKENIIVIGIDDNQIQKLLPELIICSSGTLNNIRTLTTEKLLPFFDKKFSAANNLADPTLIWSAKKVKKYKVDNSMIRSTALCRAIHYALQKYYNELSTPASIHINGTRYYCGPILFKHNFNLQYIKLTVT